MLIEDFIQCLSVFRQPYLYHAAQLRDFETYAQLGYVAPREELFARQPEDFTPFESDEFDEKRGIGGDCFGNLLDQARFSKYGKGIPNIYGPITLVFRPAALRNCGSRDITIRRNAIYTGDAARADTLNCEQIRELYHPQSELARSGEFQIHSGALQLSDLAYILVNPIAIQNDSLLARVRMIAATFSTSSGRPVRAYERTFGDDGLAIYSDLVAWAMGFRTNHGSYKSLPKNLSDRFDSLPWMTSFKAPQLERFAQYLDHGTLSRMRGEKVDFAATVTFDSIFEDAEYDERSDFFERILSLDDDRVIDRDKLLDEVAEAEQRLIEARENAEDDDESQIEIALDNYCESISSLNYWIEETKAVILAGLSEFIQREVKGQDTQLAANISGWADEFDDVDYPNTTGDALSEPLVNWEQVRDYPTTCG